MNALLSPTIIHKALKINGNNSLTKDFYQEHGISHHFVIEEAARQTSQLFDSIDMLRDEILRIKACTSQSEVTQLCERALSDVQRKVPFLEDLEKLTHIKAMIDADLIIYRDVSYSPETHEVVEK